MLTDVHIADSIKVIGCGAFKDCKNLKKVYLPKDVSPGPYSGGNAYPGPFYGCANLREIEFAKGYTEIKDALFESTGLITITLPDTLTDIDQLAFANCTNLTTIKWNKSIVNLGRTCFKNCTNIKEVILSDSVKVIGCGAFYNCTGITKIYLPKDVNSGPYSGGNAYPGPFYGCTNLKNVEFAKGYTEIKDALLEQTGIVTINIPNTVVKIDYKAFNSCTNLKTINWGTAISQIDQFAFGGCSSLTEVILPNSVREIGCAAFQDCSNITKIYLPKNIQTGAYCGENKYYPYPFQNCWNVTTVEFAKGTTVLNNGILGKTGIKNLTLPDTITKLGDRAFWNCYLLENIKLSSNLKEIGYEEFMYCHALKSIQIPDTVNSIDASTFCGCESLSSVKLPKHRENIMSNMFKDCTSLKSISLPSTIKYIRSSAFENSGIESLTLPSEVELIEAYAFKGSKLKSINLSNAKKLSSIGNYAFSDCDSLTTISIPNCVKGFGRFVFKDSDSLKNVTLGTGITSIPESTFEHCDSLQNFSVPYSVTRIDKNAFKACINFSSISMLKNVTYVDDTAFSYYGLLTIYGVAGSYAEQFADDNYVKFVKIPPFVDVKTSDWFYEAVKYTYDKKMISGLNDYTFGPYNKLSRGMLVTILWRMEGSPSTKVNKFSDVKSNDWYHTAVNWAASKGIVKGYSNGKFGPKDNITREQLCAILMNYAKYKGKNVSSRTSIKGFKDYSKIESYFRDPVSWCYAKKIIGGKENGTKIDPKGTATRAEAATMLMKYCTNVK